MPKKQQTPLRRALQEEQRRYAAQGYPGDLAVETLEQATRQGRLQRLRYPALACAVLGLGLAITITLLPNGDPPDSDSQMLAVQPTPGPAHTQSEEIPAPPPTQPDSTAKEQGLSTTQVAAQQLPEIDRDLLPLTRSSQATWLSGPVIHQQQLGKQSRLAEHPNPTRRLRYALSVPTRRSIDRAFTRSMALKTTTKPERNS